MANTKITSRVIADDAVLTANIADDAVTAAKLANDIAISTTGDLTVTSSTSNKPVVTIKNTNADANAPQSVFNKDSSSPADNDEVGRIYMYGDDDGGNAFEAVLIRGITTDVSNGSEDSTLEFFTQKAGTQVSTLSLASGNVVIGGTSKIRFDHSLIGDDIFDTDSFGIACDHTESIRMGTESSDGSSFTERFRIDNTGSQSQYGGQDIDNNFYADSGSNQGSVNLRFNTDGSSADQFCAFITMQQGSGDGGSQKGEILFGTADNGNPSTAMLIENNKNVRIYGSQLMFPNGLGASSGHSDVNYNTSTGIITYRSSSRRYKKDIIDLDIDTTKLYDLRTVRYTDKSTEERCFGLIAEEVESVMPELVNKKVIEEGKDAVADNITYSTLSVLLLKELQSTKTRLDDALARIKTLEDT